MSPNCSQQSSVDANVSLRRQRWGTTKLIEQGCSKSRDCDYESRDLTILIQRTLVDILSKVVQYSDPSIILAL